MDLDQRVDVYLKQGPRPTPAQRRRCVKKARRDLLDWSKDGMQSEQLPDDETFTVAGTDFRLAQNLALRERRSARAVLRSHGFRFLGDPALVAELIKLAKR